MHHLISTVSAQVDASIAWLTKDFLCTPNKYLTEDDVRLHLCMQLLKYFGDIDKTEDGDCSIPLHSEVRWWGPAKRKERSDIVIFNLSGLSVTKPTLDGLYKFHLIPQKGYASSVPIAAIELKLRRSDDRKSDKSFVNDVIKDKCKLEELHREMAEDNSMGLVCRVVALDKKTRISESQFLDTDALVKVSYCFADRASPMASRYT